MNKHLEDVKQRKKKWNRSRWWCVHVTFHLPLKAEHYKKPTFSSNLENHWNLPNYILSVLAKILTNHIYAFYTLNQWSNLFTKGICVSEIFPVATLIIPTKAKYFNILIKTVIMMLDICWFTFNQILLHTENVVVVTMLLLYKIYTKWYWTVLFLLSNKYNTLIMIC